MTSKSPDFADTCREVMARMDAAHTLLSSTVTDDAEDEARLTNAIRLSEERHREPGEF
jgi:hypothetical protein